MHQCNPQCVEQEKSSLSNRTTPKYNLSFDCASTALPGIHKGMEELSIFSGCYDTFCGCIQGMPKTEDEWISNQLGDLLLCMKIALNKQSFNKNIAGLDLDSTHHSHHVTYIRS